MIERMDSGPRMSAIVKHNGLVWLAGQVGTGATVAEQTADCLRQIDALLARAGSSKDKILQAIIWLDDIRTFDEMNKVWEAWVVPGQTPARATGEVRLAGPNYKVEITVTAAV